jgi:two-component system sensor histidine kinase EvgS
MKSAGNLITLINDVLDIPRLESGEVGLNREIFDLCQLVRECLAVVSCIVKEGVELKSDLPEAEMGVTGDKARIRYIFLNLLDKSARFTEKGYIRVSLIDMRSAGNGMTSFTFCIEDTGSGISDDAIKRLFFPFAAGRREKPSSIGLGLYAARSLAQMMGGDIKAESIEGEGTVFYISFMAERS